MGNNVVKNLLMAPKDRDSISNKGAVINRYKCDHLGCTMEYIRETGRNFEDKYKEHSQTTGHSIKLDNFSILDRESLSITRTIKEAMYIRGQWPPFKQEPCQVPAATHLGWGATRYAGSPFTVIPYSNPFIFSPPGPSPNKGAHNNLGQTTLMCNKL